MWYNKKKYFFLILINLIVELNTSTKSSNNQWTYSFEEFNICTEI